MYQITIAGIARSIELEQVKGANGLPSKKAFRTALGLTSSQTNKAWPEFYNRFLAANTAAAAVRIERDGLKVKSVKECRDGGLTVRYVPQLSETLELERKAARLEAQLEQLRAKLAK